MFGVGVFVVDMGGGPPSACGISPRKGGERGKGEIPAPGAGMTELGGNVNTP